MEILDDIGYFFGLGGGYSTTHECEVESMLAGGATFSLQGGDKPPVVDVGLDEINVEVGGSDRLMRAEIELSVPEPTQTTCYSTATSNLAIAAEHGATPDVDDCLMADANLRAAGCDIRPVQIAVALLPSDCHACIAECRCECC